MIISEGKRESISKNTASKSRRCLVYANDMFAHIFGEVVEIVDTRGFYDKNMAFEVAEEIDELVLQQKG
jgi:hypothetical protein